MIVSLFLVCLLWASKRNSYPPDNIKYKTVCYLNLSLQQLMLQQGEYLLLIGLPQSQTDFITHGIFNACIIFS